MEDPFAELMDDIPSTPLSPPISASLNSDIGNQAANVDAPVVSPTVLPVTTTGGGFDPFADFQSSAKTDLVAVTEDDPFAVLSPTSVSTNNVNGDEEWDAFASSPAGPEMAPGADTVIAPTAVEADEWDAFTAPTNVQPMVTTADTVITEPLTSTETHENEWNDFSAPVAVISPSSAEVPGALEESVPPSTEELSSSETVAAETDPFAEIAAPSEASVPSGTEEADEWDAFTAPTAVNATATVSTADEVTVSESTLVGEAQENELNDFSTVFSPSSAVALEESVPPSTEELPSAEETDPFAEIAAPSEATVPSGTEEADEWDAFTAPASVENTVALESSTTTDLISAPPHAPPCVASEVVTSLPALESPIAPVVVDKSDPFADISIDAPRPFTDANVEETVPVAPEIIAADTPTAADFDAFASSAHFKGVSSALSTADSEGQKVDVAASDAASEEPAPPASEIEASAIATEPEVTGQPSAATTDNLMATPGASVGAENGSVRHQREVTEHSSDVSVDVSVDIPTEVPVETSSSVPEDVFAGIAAEVSAEHAAVDVIPASASASALVGDEPSTDNASPDEAVVLEKFPSNPVTEEDSSIHPASINEGIAADNSAVSGSDGSVAETVVKVEEVISSSVSDVADVETTTAVNDLPSETNSASSSTEGSDMGDIVVAKKGAEDNSVDIVDTSVEVEKDITVHVEEHTAPVEQSEIQESTIAHEAVTTSSDHFADITEDPTPLTLNVRAQKDSVLQIHKESEIRPAEEPQVCSSESVSGAACEIEADTLIEASIPVSSIGPSAQEDEDAWEDFAAPVSSSARAVSTPQALTLEAEDIPLGTSEDPFESFAGSDAQPEAVDLVSSVQFDTKIEGSNTAEGVDVNADVTVAGTTHSQIEEEDDWDDFASPVPVSAAVTEADSGAGSEAPRAEEAVPDSHNTVPETVAVTTTTEGNDDDEWDDFAAPNAASEPLTMVADSAPVITPNDIKNAKEEAEDDDDWDTFESAPSSSATDTTSAISATPAPAPAPATTSIAPTIAFTSVSLQPASGDALTTMSQLSSLLTIGATAVNSAYDDLLQQWQHQCQLIYGAGEQSDSVFRQYQTNGSSLSEAEALSLAPPSALTGSTAAASFPASSSSSSATSLRTCTRRLLQTHIPADALPLPALATQLERLEAAQQSSYSHHHHNKHMRQHRWSQQLSQSLSRSYDISDSPPGGRPPQQSLRPSGDSINFNSLQSNKNSTSDLSSQVKSPTVPLTAPAALVAASGQTGAPPDNSSNDAFGGGGANDDDDDWTAFEDAPANPATSNQSATLTSPPPQVPPLPTTTTSNKNQKPSSDSQQIKTVVGASVGITGAKATPPLSPADTFLRSLPDLAYLLKPVQE